MCQACYWAQRARSSSSPTTPSTPPPPGRHRRVHPDRPDHQRHPGRADATGPAAFGLCTAWQHAQAHGQASQDSVAFQNLAAAAGGAANVTAFCDTVSHPGTTPPGQASTHATGKPSTLPTRHATGKPSTPAHATGKPGSAPSHP